MRFLFFVGVFLCIGADLPAGIIATSGNVDLLVAAPASVLLGALEDNVLTRVFEEKTVTLGATLWATNTATGDYPPNPNLGVAIPAGVRLTSFYLHFDPLGSEISASLGTLTFDQDIIGIITGQGRLANSTPVVGLATTSYPADQGLEIGWVVRAPHNDDFLNLSANLRVLTFDLDASTGLDPMRVLVAAPVPEPSSFLQISLPLVWWAARRRFRRTRSGPSA